jgi:hypothetical protein
LYCRHTRKADLLTDADGKRTWGKEKDAADF